MYGRCETDPFDQAIDVCDVCYGEFCRHCLVTPKGRKHPICRECAIVVSGLRPGTRPLMRGSRRTAATRRQSLRAAPRTPAVLHYFDEEPEPVEAGERPNPAQADEPPTVEPGDSSQAAEAAEIVEAAETVEAAEAVQAAETVEAAETDETVAAEEAAEAVEAVEAVDLVQDACEDGGDDDGRTTGGFRPPRPFVPAAPGPATTATAEPATDESGPAGPSGATPAVTGIDWTVDSGGAAPLPRRRAHATIDRRT